jgi:ABC-type branched-subunit amino acid transport system substrate-binding protein
MQIDRLCVLLASLLLFVSIGQALEASPQATQSCSSFFTVSTYSNTTKAVGSEQFAIGMVGSYKYSNMTEKESMMKFAVDYINTLPDLLPNTSLELLGTEITAVKSTTILAAISAVNSKVRVMIGGTSETETDSVYAIASRYTVLNVAPFTNSDKYDAPASYPYLIRPTQVTGTQSSVVAGIIKYFGWSRAIILIGDDQNGLDAYNYLSLSPYAKLIFNQAYSIVTVTAASTNDASTITSIKKLANTTRIILMALPVTTAIRILPLMNAAGMVTEDYVYVLGDQITQALQNNPEQFIPVNQYLNGSIAYAPKGLGLNDFYYSMYDAWMSADPTVYPGSRPPAANTWLSFESIYMIAKALDNLINTGLDANSVTTLQLRNEMASLNYLGVTGQVSFNSTSAMIDRLGLWDIFNYYNDQLDFKFSMANANPAVAYDIVAGNFSFFDGRSDIPIDYFNPKPPASNTSVVWTPSMRQYNKAISGVFGAIIGVCTIIAIFAGVVLAIYPSEFVSHGIEFSAIIVAGSFISFAGAFTLLPEKTDKLCMAFPWLAGIAFNIVYGSIFVISLKIFIAHRQGKDFLKTKVAPLHLLFAIVAFALIEVAFLIIWTVVDPLKVAYVEMWDSSFELQCHNSYPTFWAIWVGYKGIWVVIGSIFAYLSREIIKDGGAEFYKSLTYATYNNLGLFLIGIPAGIGLWKVNSGMLIIEVAVVVLSFTFTNFIMFFDTWYRIFFAHKDIVGQASKSAEAAATRRGGPGGSHSTSHSGKLSHSHSAHSGVQSAHSANGSGGSPRANTSKNSKNSGSSHSDAYVE